MDKRAFTGSLLSQLASHGGGMPLPCDQAARTGSAYPPAVPAPPPARRVLVVSDLPEQDAVSVLQEAYALRRFGFRVEAMVPAPAVARLARYAQPGTLLDADAPADPRVWDGLDAVLAVPSQDLLARLALGLQDRPGSWLILQALWRGVRVWMDFSCITPSADIPCANPAMAAFYEGYAGQLRALGVHPVAPGEYLIALREQGGLSPREDVSGQIQMPRTAPPPAQASTSRVVITQQDVLAHTPSQGVWFLPAGALVTPLARDTAKKLGLELCPEDSSPQPGRNE